MSRFGPFSYSRQPCAFLSRKSAGLLTRPSIIQKASMICAFPSLIKTADSRGVAVGPESMRVL
jgi:hypothetical protein